MEVWKKGEKDEKTRAEKANAGRLHASTSLTLILPSKLFLLPTPPMLPFLFYIAS